jgi:hypothetical protein
VTVAFGSRDRLLLRHQMADNPGLVASLIRQSAAPTARAA